MMYETTVHRKSGKAITQWLGKATKCEFCKKTIPEKGHYCKFGDFVRDYNKDINLRWFILCVPCAKKFGSYLKRKGVKAVD